jgi:hypothetical protein
LLSEIFRDLATVDLDFSIEVTGFSVGEIDPRIEGLSASTGSELDPADEVPEVSEQAPVSKPGDLWLLRKHRVFCGDALETGSYRALMQCELAQVVFTDPPFNVPVHGHVCGNGKIRLWSAKTSYSSSDALFQPVFVM